ncbi:META domain-containing protein [Streptomyces tsukubensis]|uniref:DUF306 domain-containing protein n=1 Tax=Streptomyces tsukubensis TaxID=83656 RepID=A0A1V4A4H9_9ACTN|nr:META domain-containing protein [Streptomyces tsukubensis]OON75617.1 hypothetical protein B1H18_22430 [Streptomyces tsukubensis]QFR94400.1 META domain-containing protein [Streptomyces tsukubensis]
MDTHRPTRPTLIVRGALSVLAGCGVLVACGTDSGSGGSGSVETRLPVTGVRWNVDRVTADGTRSTAPAGAHVEFGKNGRVTGNLGCNRFSSGADLREDSVRIQRATLTKVACDKKTMRFEKALGSALTGTLKAKVGKGRLTLTTAKGDTVDLTSEHPAPLTGTTWRVTALVDKEKVTALPDSVDGKARLVFGKDGTVRGSLGCNRVTAKARIHDGHITLGKPVTTRMMCTGDRMATERALLALFDSTVSYDLSHRGLSLKAENGKGLDATAEKDAS